MHRRALAKGREGGPCLASSAIAKAQRAAEENRRKEENKKERNKRVKFQKFYKNLQKLSMSMHAVSHKTPEVHVNDFCLKLAGKTLSTNH